MPLAEVVPASQQPTTPRGAGLSGKGKGPEIFRALLYGSADLGSNSLSEQVRKDSGVCTLFAEIVCFVLWNFASSVLRFRTSIQVASNQEVDDQCKY